MAFAIDTYTGNGSTTNYSITFPYIEQAHVVVTVDGVTKSLTTDYTFSNSSTIAFNSAPASSAIIKITRSSNRTARLTDYQDGSTLTEATLDQDGNQTFFMAQEAIDITGNNIGLSGTTDQWDANSKRITNVANPVNNNDAVNKTYLENTWLTTANKTALTTVNANIANINAVNSNATNINSAVSNATNINTVATNIGSVNTVATDIAKVITVANDLAEAVSEVETVADDLNETSSEIEVVGGAITNVNNVGNNIANVNTVAGISANVTTVAGNNSNVSTVAGISSDVTAVAGISSDVQAVENIASNVTTVAGISSAVSSVAGISTAVSNVNSNSSNINAVNSNATNINTVAGNNSNISTVSGISGNVSTVAGVASNVTTVAGISSAVSTVSGMSTAINTANSNSSNINTVAGAIANVNNVGGSIASVNSVATNLASVNSFANTYLGASGSAPTQDPDGSALDLGDLYFDTGSNQLKVYSSTGWVNAGSSVNGTSDRFKYTVSGTPTTISGNDDNSKSLSYDAGFIDVFLNGIKMVNGTDVTVTSGNSVVFASALTNGDVVDIITFGTFNIASMNASNLSSGTVPDARITGDYTGLTSLTITRADNSNALSLVSTDADANSAPILSMRRESGSPADNDLIGQLDFIGKDSGGANTQYASIKGIIKDVTHNTEDGALEFVTFKSGFLNNALTLGNTETVFNDASVDVDFRVESNGNANMLFVDGGNNKVGIATSTPEAQFQTDVASATIGGGRIYTNAVRTGVNSSAVFSVRADNASGSSSGDVVNIQGDGVGDLLTLNNNGTDRVTVQADGKVSIGTSSSGVTPNGNADELFVEGSGNSGITIGSGTANAGQLCFGDSGDNDIGAIAYLHDVNAMRFTTSGIERARFLGNTFMVGKTSGSGATNGVELKSNDESRFTQTSRAVIAINRLSSDGNIVELKKDNTLVGSIGSVSSKLHIASTGNSGIRFRDDLNGIIPCNADGSNSDDDQDLGHTGVRYRRLYLSEGVFLGGTGTANKLDDYEEGTWTPSDASGAGLSYSNTSGNCFYTKIGNVVYASFRVTFPSTSNTSSATVGGFPFVASASSSVNTDTVSFGEQNLGAGTMAIMNRGASNFLILTTNGSSVSVKTNANCSGKDFRGIAVYKV